MFSNALANYFSFKTTCIFCLLHHWIVFISSFETDNTQDGFSQSNGNIKFVIDGVQVQVPTEKFSDFTKGEGKLSASPVLFDPPYLDFREKPVGQPHIEHVTVLNVDPSQTLHLISIFASTPHFHSSFFQNTQVNAGSNTTFDVVFLPRTVGSVQSTLFIHTTTGVLSYSVQGVGVPSPYRLQPYLNVRIPLNATFSPLLHIHNPHPVDLQIVEMFTNGGDLHLELPNSEFPSTGVNNAATESASKLLWRIPPYETRTVMRLRMTALKEGNHTGFMKIRCNLSLNLDSSSSSTQQQQQHQSHEFDGLKKSLAASYSASHENTFSPSSSTAFDPAFSSSSTLLSSQHIIQLILPVEVEVTSKPGLFHLLDQLNFGLLRALDQPKTMRLTVVNTFHIPAHIKSVHLSSRNDAVNVELRSMKVVPGIQRSTTIALVTFHAAKAINPKQWNGTIIVESVNPPYRLEIPYSTTVLHGSLVYDANITKFFSGKESQENETRSIPLTNTFHTPLAVYSVTLQGEALKHFQLISFSRPVIIGAQETNDFIRLRFHPRSTQSQFITQMSIYSNASLFVIPLFVYHGKLTIVPHRPEVYPGNLDFGTLGVGEQRSLSFTLRNENPVDVQIRQISTNWNHAELVLRGSERGNGTTLSHDHGAGKRKITSFLLRPYHFAVMSLLVNAPTTEGVFAMEIRVLTQFETLSIPYGMRTADGSLTAIPEVLILEESFPTRRSSGLLRLRSTFEEFTELKLVHFQSQDLRFNFEPSPGRQLPLLLKPKETTVVGRVNFDPLHTCMGQLDVDSDFLNGKLKRSSQSNTEYSTQTHGASLILPSKLRRAILKKCKTNGKGDFSNEFSSKQPTNCDSVDMNHAGRRVIPTVSVSNRGCYVGFDTKSLIGHHWLSSFSLEPDHYVSDIDWSIYHQLRHRWEAFHLADEHSVNVTMILDTAHVKGFLSHVQAAMVWPTIMQASRLSNSDSTTKPTVTGDMKTDYPHIVSQIIQFPITQLGNTTEQQLQLHNPSDQILLVQVIPISLYPKSAMLLEKLGIVGGDVEMDDPELFSVHYSSSEGATGDKHPQKRKSSPNSKQHEKNPKTNHMTIKETTALFSLPSACDVNVLDGKKQAEEFENEAEENVSSTQRPVSSGTVCVALPPRGEVTISIRFRPKQDGQFVERAINNASGTKKVYSHSLLIVRNNLTGLDTVLLRGRGAMGRLEFGLPPMDTTGLMDNTGVVNNLHPTVVGGGIEELSKVGSSPSIIATEVPYMSSGNGPGACKDARKSHAHTSATSAKDGNLAVSPTSSSFSSSSAGGSTALFLLFELTERHLKNCDQSNSGKTSNFPLPVRRHFVIYNTGELPVYVRGFSFGPSSSLTVQNNMENSQTATESLSTGSLGLEKSSEDDLSSTKSHSSVKGNGVTGTSFLTFAAEEESWCSGYGFSVLHCESFLLPVNSSRKFVVAFTPDFSLHHIQQTLHVHTSLGSPYELTVQATLPMHMLSVCSRAIPRPELEAILWYFFFGCSVFVLLAVLLMSYLDADRMFRRDSAKRQQIAIDYALRQHPDARKVFDLNNLNYSFLPISAAEGEGGYANATASQRHLSMSKESTNAQVMRVSESEGDSSFGSAFCKESDQPINTTMLSSAQNLLRSSLIENHYSENALRQRGSTLGEITHGRSGFGFGGGHYRGRGRVENSGNVSHLHQHSHHTFSSDSANGLLVGKNRRGFWGALWQWLCSLFWWSLSAEQRRNALKPKLEIHQQLTSSQGGSLLTHSSPNEGSSTHGSSSRMRSRYGASSHSNIMSSSNMKKGSPNNSPKPARVRTNKLSTPSPQQEMPPPTTGNVTGTRRTSNVSKISGTSAFNIVNSNTVGNNQNTKGATSSTTRTSSILDFAPIDIPVSSGGTTYKVQKGTSKISLATVAPVRRKQQPTMVSSNLSGSTLQNINAPNTISQLNPKRSGANIHDEDPDEALVLRGSSSSSDNDDTSLSVHGRNSPTGSSLSASLSSNRDRYQSSQKNQGFDYTEGKSSLSSSALKRSSNAELTERGSKSKPGRKKKESAAAAKIQERHHHKGTVSNVEDSGTKVLGKSGEKLTLTASCTGKRSKTNERLTERRSKYLGEGEEVHASEDEIEDDGNDAEDEEEEEQQSGKFLNNPDNETSAMHSQRSQSQASKNGATSRTSGVTEGETSRKQPTNQMFTDGTKDDNSLPNPKDMLTPFDGSEELSRTMSTGSKLSRALITSIVKPVVQRMSLSKSDEKYEDTWPFPTNNVHLHDLHGTKMSNEISSLAKDLSYHSDLIPSKFGYVICQQAPKMLSMECPQFTISYGAGIPRETTDGTQPSCYSVVASEDEESVPSWDIDITTLDGSWSGDLEGIADYTQRVSNIDESASHLPSSSSSFVNPPSSQSAPFIPRHMSGSNPPPTSHPPPPALSMLYSRDTGSNTTNHPSLGESISSGMPPSSSIPVSSGMWFSDGATSEANETKQNVFNPSSEMSTSSMNYSSSISNVNTIRSNTASCVKSGISSHSLVHPHLHSYAPHHYTSASMNPPTMPAIPIPPAAYHRGGLASFQPSLPATPLRSPYPPHGIISLQPIPSSHLLSASGRHYPPSSVPGQPIHQYSSLSFRPVATAPVLPSGLSQPSPRHSSSQFFTGMDMGHHSLMASDMMNFSPQGYHADSHPMHNSQSHPQVSGMPHFHGHHLSKQVTFDLDESSHIYGHSVNPLPPPSSSAASTATNSHQQCELLRMTQDRRQSMLEHERRVQQTSRMQSQPSVPHMLPTYSGNEGLGVDYDSLLGMEEDSSSILAPSPLSHASLIDLNPSLTSGLMNGLDDEPDWLMALDACISNKQPQLNQHQHINHMSMPPSACYPSSAYNNATMQGSSSLMDDDVTTSMMGMYDNHRMNLWETGDYSMAAEMNCMDNTMMNSLLPSNLLPNLNPSHDNISAPTNTDILPTGQGNINRFGSNLS